VRLAEVRIRERDRTIAALSGFLRERGFRVEV